MRRLTIPPSVEIDIAVPVNGKHPQLLFVEWFRLTLATSSVWTEAAANTDAFCAIDDKLGRGPEQLKPGDQLDLTDAEHELLQKAALTHNYQPELRQYCLRLIRAITTAPRVELAVAAE